jgi:tartrate-resistant acid phosphatase type 5
MQCLPYFGRRGKIQQKGGHSEMKAMWPGGWMKKFFFGFYLLLGSLAAGPAAEAAVTLPDIFDELPPASISIPGDIPITISEATLKTTGIRILVFGDSATGDAVQMKVAQGMQDFCAKNDCHFGLMLGDNIYPTGVRNTDDPQFIDKFEKPYGGLGILIFGVLGEHDWGRKGEMYNWKAQIDYSKKSKFWRMPSDVYSVTLNGLKILALNTNAFPISQYQKKWLADEIQNSKARWNLVIGHKPIHSYGRHGDTPFMVKEVLPLLCGRVDLYLSGHEHTNQVLKADCGLPLVVTGAAGELRREKITGPRTLFVDNEAGFAYLVIKEDQITVQMVSENGEIGYSLEIPKK